MERRRLGRTGHDSSVAILGGAAFWDGDPETTGAAFAAALAAGVNHLDVAPQYGRAQEALGPFIPAVRNRLFVACKTLHHRADDVRAQLEESLGLLRCDRFDLYQLHAVTDLAELDARSGAVEAILAARDEGLCRFVGITGHNLDAPGAHLEALRRYDLDTVMFPVNPRLWADRAIPRRRRGPARVHNRARRRGDGDQGCRGPSVGRADAHRHDLVRALHRRTRPDPGHRVRALDPRGARLLHARGQRAAPRSPGRSRLGPSTHARRNVTAPSRRAPTSR